MATKTPDKLRKRTKGTIGTKSKSTGNLLDLSNVSLSNLKIPLKGSSEVNKAIKRDYILTGYLDCENPPKIAKKVDNKKLTTCNSSLHTLLSCHNETVNIYTHLIPGLFVLGSLIFDIIEAIFDTNMYRVVMVTFGVSLFLCFFCSAIFHLSLCVVPTKESKFFMVDLIGIVSLIVASFDVGIYVAYQCFYFWKVLYLIAFNFIFGFGLIPILFIWPDRFPLSPLHCSIHGTL